MNLFKISLSSHFLAHFKLNFTSAYYKTVHNLIVCKEVTNAGNGFKNVKHNMKIFERYISCNISKIAYPRLLPIHFSETAEIIISRLSL